MTGINGIRLLALVLLCSFSSLYAEGIDRVFENGAIVLPRVFEGLGWTYDEQALRQKLPSSHVENVEGTDGVIDSIFSRFELPDFGPAQVEVVHDKSGNVRFYTVATDEPRIQQCAPELEGRPKNCRNRFGPHLTRIRDKLLARIKPAYGKGIVSRSCYWDYDLRRKICVDDHAWLISKITKMSLQIYEGEDGWWEVSLIVMKVPSSR